MIGRLPALLLVLAIGTLPTAAAAFPYEIPYAGRLADAAGAPLSGPVDLEVRFFLSATGVDAADASPLTFPGTVLQNGMFQLPLALSPQDFHRLFTSTAPQAVIKNGIITAIQ